MAHTFVFVDYTAFLHQFMVFESVHILCDAQNLIPIQVKCSDSNILGVWR